MEISFQTQPAIQLHPDDQVAIALENARLFQETQEALKVTRGGRQDAAKLLGWGRNTLTRKLKELGMDDIPE